jgi:hypothetical protein
MNDSMLHIIVKIDSISAAFIAWLSRGRRKCESRSRRVEAVKKRSEASAEKLLSARSGVEGEGKQSDFIS